MKSVISNTIQGAGAGVVVTATLYPLNVPAFSVTDNSEVQSPITTTTDSGGSWSLSLERTADTVPNTTYWEIVEDTPGSLLGGKVSTIAVGSSNATLLASLISPISSILSNYLTQTAADARYITEANGDLRYLQLLNVPYFNVAAFGADPTGILDATPGIDAACAACGAAGGGVVVFDGRFRIASIRHSPAAIQFDYSKVTLLGTPNSVIFTDLTPATNEVIFGNSPTRATYSSLTLKPCSSVLQGSQTVTTTTASDASGFSPGDVIYIRGGTAGAQPNAEINRVASADPSTGIIVLREPTAKAYSASPLGIANATSITAQNLRVEHITIDHQIAAFACGQTYGLTFNDIEFIGDPNGGPPTISGFSRQVLWENVRVWSPNTTSTGPMQIDAQVDATIHQCHVYGLVANLLNLSDGAANIKVISSEFGGTGPITFADCNDVLFEANDLANTIQSAGLSSGAGGAVTARLTIRSNRLRFLGTEGSVSLNGVDHTVVDNDIISNGNTDASAFALTFSGDATGGIIADNRIRCINSSGSRGAIEISATHPGMSITNNTCIAAVSGTFGIVVTDSGVQTLGPVVANNTLVNYTNAILFSNVAHEPGYSVSGNAISGATTPYSPEQLGGITTTLPTADPHVVHQLWSNAGVVTVSAG